MFSLPYPIFPLSKRTFGLFSIIAIVFTQAKPKIFAKIYADKYEMVFIFLNFYEILPKKDRHKRSGLYHLVKMIQQEKKMSFILYI